MFHRVALALLAVLITIATAHAEPPSKELSYKAEMAGTVVAPEPLASASTGNTKSKVVVLTDSNWKTHGPPAFPEDTFVVKFYAPWCGHCRSLAPDWERLASDLSEETGKKYHVCKIDVTNGGDKTGELYGVQSFPTLYRFSGGKYTHQKGQRHLVGLTSWATTVPDASTEYGEPNPYLQMLHPMKAVAFFMRFGKWLEKQLSAHPSSILLVAAFALGMITFMGYFLGKELKYNRQSFLFIKFPKKERFTRFGLRSLDPEYSIETDASMGPGQHYVNKKDKSKHYSIPGSMSFNIPVPPPPAGAPEKK